MIERLTDLPAGVEGLRAKGKVTREDYEGVVQPVLDEARSQGRRRRFLYHFGPEFRFHRWRGMGKRAAGSAIPPPVRTLCHRQRHRLDPRIVAAGRRLDAVSVRVFGNDQWQEALAWLTSSDAGGGLAHRLLPEPGVLVVEPVGPLRSEDFDALALAVDPWIEAHGGLRGLVVHAREFPGWESPGSFYRHLRFVATIIGRSAAWRCALGASWPRWRLHWPSTSWPRRLSLRLQRARACCGLGG